MVVDYERGERLLRESEHDAAVVEELREISDVFFFQAEDGIRDGTVTGVQTCALPILTRGLRESAIIALGIVALVLLIALLTYSPDDPGFSFTGNSAPVRNRIGVIGAWLADVLFFLFGRPAFLFPLVLGTACWGLQRRMRTEGVSRANTLVRIAGFVLVLVASCGLTTLHWQPGALRQTAGGVVGSVVGGGLVAGLDFLGATLVMLAAWMAGLSLAFG